MLDNREGNNEGEDNEDEPQASSGLDRAKLLKTTGVCSLVWARKGKVWELSIADDIIGGIVAD